MNLFAYSFFDTKASFFSPPFFFSHNGLAMRAASDLTNDPSTTIGRHPADFCLMLVGTFDDQTGVFAPQNPENLAVCTAFLRTQGDLLNG